MSERRGSKAAMIILLILSALCAVGAWFVFELIEGLGSPFGAARSEPLTWDALQDSDRNIILGLIGGAVVFFVLAIIARPRGTAD